MVSAVSSTKYSNKVSPNAPIQAERKPLLDKIILESEQIKENSKTSSPMKKFMAYPTLSLVPLLAFFVGECGVLIRLGRAVKKVKKHTISEKAAEKIKKNAPKKLMIMAGLMIPIGIAMNILNNKTKEKHHQNAENIVNNFNKENKSNLNLVIQPINSQIIAALTDPLSGRVILGEQFCNDSIYANTHQKPMLNHELVHAKQYALMARAENGLEKLNFDVVKKTAEGFNEAGKEEIKNSYAEVQSGLNDYYKNATIDRFGYKIPLVDYITALYKVIYEPSTTEKDIPIIINKEYYQSIIEQKGKLTAEEETKAKAYFEAYEKYPNTIHIGKILNPNSDYKQNLLEQEAFKMNPWYTR